MQMQVPVEATIDELVSQFDAFGFDSFGVLVDGKDPLPGAADLLQHLNAIGKPLVVATNDASKLPERRVSQMREQGFDVELDNVVTSGSLLEGWATRNGLVGSRVMATGSGEAVEYVKLAGMVPVPLDVDDEEARGLVIAGITGYDWDAALSDILTLLFRKLDAGIAFPGAVPNPDVLYPDGGDRYAIGPGGLAELIESALNRGFVSEQRWRFDRLGKPHAPMFDEIERRLPKDSRIVFFGDQLQTDIQGANNAGIDSVLMTTGITRVADLTALADVDAELRPTYVVETLETRPATRAI